MPPLNGTMGYQEETECDVASSPTSVFSLLTLLDASIDVVFVSDNARMPKQSVTEQFLLRRKPATKTKPKNRWDCMTASRIAQTRAGCDQQGHSTSSDLNTSGEIKKPSRRPSVQEDEDAMGYLVNIADMNSMEFDVDCQLEGERRSSLDKKKPMRRQSTEETKSVRLSCVEESEHGEGSEGYSSSEEAGEAGEAGEASDVLSALAYEQISMPTSSARPCSDTPRMPMRMMSLEKTPSTFQILATLQAEMEEEELEEEPTKLHRLTDGLSHSAFCDALRVRYASPPTSS
jgi:hypothetical protein